MHHLYDREQDYLIEILAECKRAGNPDLVYKFSSTSKITFPGSGIAAIAASSNNLEDIQRQLRYQTIGHDKVNQLRHVRFFEDIHNMIEHMRKHADILRPKFETVETILEKNLGGLGIGSWTRAVVAMTEFGMTTVSPRRFEMVVWRQFTSCTTPASPPTSMWSPGTTMPMSRVSTNLSHEVLLAKRRDNAIRINAANRADPFS